MAEQRYRTTLPARFAASSFRASGEIENVGHQGLFVGTASIPPTGETVTLEFTGPDGGRIRVAGIVWWTTVDRTVPGQTPGFGVRLLDSPPRYVRFVDRLAS